MARGRKKGQKIGKVMYRLVVHREQGKSDKVVGDKYVQGKPSWADKSPKKVEAGKKSIQYLRKKASGKSSSYYNPKTGEAYPKRGRPKGSKNKPK